jgi:energy-coupling factor transporter ATP-binding protein EcfA2
MQFHVVPHFGRRPPPNTKFPCALLVRDNWNDFGWQTTFEATIFMSSIDEVVVGPTKILIKGKTVTDIKEGLDKIGVPFCSIGQTFDFYRNLQHVPENVRERFLNELNDIVHNPQKATRLLDDRGFDQSLLRFGEALKLHQEGLAALGPAEQVPFTFKFTCRLDDALGDHEVNFAFLDQTLVPSRINVLVGKNGSGKTKFLAKLAAAISGANTPGGIFEPKRPPFSKTLGIAYSPFDPFADIAQLASSASFRYCGLFDGQNGLKSRVTVEHECAETYNQAKHKQRDSDWFEAIKLVFPGDEAVTRLLTDLAGPDERPWAKIIGDAHLSSGQLVLFAIVGNIVAHTERGTVVLIDEPETHLHPNAIAGLMQGIHAALVKRQAYAVIATHSPLILQQVPSRYVRLFRRFDRIPEVHALPIECFGENLTTITDAAFAAFESPSLFKSWLDGLPAALPMSGIEAALGRPLGPTAGSLVESARRGKPQ